MLRGWFSVRRPILYLFAALAFVTAVPRHGMAISPARDVCAAYVRFELGSSTLSNEALGALNQFVMECGKYYGKAIVVTGAADDREESRRGLDLAQARARAVRGYLLSTGILAKSIEVQFDYGVAMSSMSYPRGATIGVK